ncbi:hypothetical protein A2797_02125 [candidate division WWE3 bacterium RIFCSPHIGHO2_01_FULL_48_15]|uniref:acylphosphatase n=1 Tax=candidate division WWE3 bacterium RIFCSPHIGHO2_01_FULL_48_15 TaxID=1802619 RepID=A0A1F4VFT0_UNCKA|nr:MAG: hypothetical protein A2797_02125 [candidate division WWE3 bacterium RIFCSPHIGHO2_01_FULL_48_15]
MAKASQLARAHLKIYGKVQNIGYRFFIHRKAAACGLTGWVCNCNSTGVEAVFEGEKEKVEECVAACRKGPRFSKIEKVDLEWQEPTGEFKSFVVR